MKFDKHIHNPLVLRLEIEKITGHGVTIATNADTVEIKDLPKGVDTGAVYNLVDTWDNATTDEEALAAQMLDAEEEKILRVLAKYNTDTALTAAAKEKINMIATKDADAKIVPEPTTRE